MRLESPHPPTSEFGAFCAAVRAWLHDAACLDPALAAVADMVAGVAPIDEQELTRVLSDAADVHGVLGASALLSLWSGRPR